jgi:hypothetical protein
VIEYLSEKDTLWVLIDNLDKGWPTRGATREDILILRSLLEAVRKLQQELDRQGVDVHALIFIRNDIYEHLVEETPDKGKDTATLIDWNDEDAFRELVRRRLLMTEGLDGTFPEMWRTLFESHVGTVESFQYVLERTLLRPRDLLNFLHRAIEVAINRGHTSVESADILQAERQYSEDMLLTVGFEISDVLPGSDDILYAFLGCPVAMTDADVRSRLDEAGLRDADLDRAVELLLWFGILGVREGVGADARYAHQLRYNLRKLLVPIERERGSFVLHPAFHKALECTA